MQANIALKVNISDTASMLLTITTFGSLLRVGLLWLMGPKDFIYEVLLIQASVRP